jgi:hypothetical protein
VAERSECTRNRRLTILFSSNCRDFHGREAKAKVERLNRGGRLMLNLTRPQESSDLIGSGQNSASPFPAKNWAGGTRGTLGRCHIHSSTSIVSHYFSSLIPKLMAKGPEIMNCRSLAVWPHCKLQAMARLKPPPLLTKIAPGNATGPCENVNTLWLPRIGIAGESESHTIQLGVLHALHSFADPTHSPSHSLNPNTRAPTSSA